MQTLNSSCDEADKTWDSKARFKRRATAVPNSIDPGAPNENIVQNHLNIALLNVF